MTNFMMPLGQVPAITGTSLTNNINMRKHDSMNMIVWDHFNICYLTDHTHCTGCINQVSHSIETIRFEIQISLTLVICRRWISAQVFRMCWASPPLPSSYNPLPGPTPPYQSTLPPSTRQPPTYSLALQDSWLFWISNSSGFQHGKTCTSCSQRAPSTRFEIFDECVSLVTSPSSHYWRSVAS